MRSKEDIELAELWACYRAVGYSATPIGQAYKAAWMRLVRERDRALGFGSWESTGRVSQSGERAGKRSAPKTIRTGPLRASIGDMLAAKQPREKRVSGGPSFPTVSLHVSLAEKLAIKRRR